MAARPGFGTIMTSLADLNAMTADELRAALSAAPERRVALLRIAAEGGAVEAQLLLGQLLLDGDGVAAAPADALRWFSTAATAGHPMGMNMVGRCMEHGWGVAADEGAAAAWYEAAAARGLDWGMYNLATLLALREGEARDLERALRLFREAAALGHAKSMNMVGSFHEDGWAVEADHDAAARWYARAAAGGDFRGRFNHARLLIEAGKIEEAVPWLRRVAETATPRFMMQMRDWLGRRNEPQLRELALDL